MLLFPLLTSRSCTYIASGLQIEYQIYMIEPRPITRGAHIPLVIVSWPTFFFLIVSWLFTRLYHAHLCKASKV